jgi:hypothetical protein
MEMKSQMKEPLGYLMHWIARTPMTPYLPPSIHHSFTLDSRGTTQNRNDAATADHGPSAVDTVRPRAAQKAVEWLESVIGMHTGNRDLIMLLDAEKVWLPDDITKQAQRDQKRSATRMQKDILRPLNIIVVTVVPFTYSY